MVDVDGDDRPLMATLDSTRRSSIIEAEGPEHGDLAEDGYHLGGDIHPPAPVILFLIAVSWLSVCVCVCV